MTVRGIDILFTGIYLMMEEYLTGLACFVCCGRGPPRFEGDRPRFEDRDGYRGGPRGGDFGGEKGGAPPEFQPSFRVKTAVFWLYFLFVFISLCNNVFVLSLYLLLL